MHMHLAPLVSFWFACFLFLGEGQDCMKSVDVLLRNVSRKDVNMDYRQSRMVRKLPGYA